MQISDAMDTQHTLIQRMQKLSARATKWISQPPSNGRNAHDDIRFALRCYFRMLEPNSHAMLESPCESLELLVREMDFWTMEADVDSFNSLILSNTKLFAPPSETAVDGPDINLIRQDFPDDANEVPNTGQGVGNDPLPDAGFFADIDAHPVSRTAEDRFFNDMVAEHQPLPDNPRLVFIEGKMLPSDALLSHCCLKDRITTKTNLAKKGAPKNSYNLTCTIVFRSRVDFDKYLFEHGCHLALFRTSITQKHGFGLMKCGYRRLLDGISVPRIVTLFSSTILVERVDARR